MLDREGRTATTTEQEVLARWSAWGALPEIFDDSREDWAGAREELKQLLPADAYAQARRTTLNAHYTHPAYVAAIWESLQRLGFDGGEVLEPGSGSGTFIGLAPENARMTGIELDSTTARISQYLYPHAKIRAESFADTRIPGGYFDATVGNVPFGDITLHDPIDNANRHALHNHFILKSLRLTRPGGVVAVLTSRFTLDQTNPAARREMAKYADLLGAVRLPTGAHKRTAGTDAVTDVLLFRRRDTAPPATGEEPWENVSARTVDGVTTKINSYFDTRPDHILGTLRISTGMHGSETLHVEPTADLADTAMQLRDALTEIVASAHERHLTLTPRTDDQPTITDHPDLDEWDGAIHAMDDGTFTVSTRDGRVPLPVPRSAAVELRALLTLRDGATRQLAMERATLDELPEITTARTQLLQRWRDYVAKYGPINRFNATPTGRVDDNGEPIMARRTPTATRLLRSDPFGPLVAALEVFDDASQTAEPAALLQRRVIAPRPEKLGADTPTEALQMSLDRTGTVDLDYIARALGETPDAARAQLGTLVYDEPGTGALIPAPAYLSGNVRTKLDDATHAAQDDPRFSINVDALRAVMPDPLTPEEITPRIGAVWISAEHHEQFLRELLNDSSLTVTNPLPAQWKVRSGRRHTVRATADWGTERRPAPDLFEALANQTVIQVFDKIEEPGGSTRNVLNPTETTAAQEKAALLQEQFEDWVWSDPDRARTLSDEYNRRFNSTVLRDYSGEGQSLTLPGLVATFQLADHQRAAIARILSEPSVGLFHEVGAGKTAVMVAGAMELRRMGMVNKVGVVVPNHMLEQFTREWLQLYPQARVLAANSATLTGDNRRLFVARAAANDWDAVILTRGAFSRLQIEPATAASFMARELELHRAALDNATDADRMTVKQIEKSLARLEETQKELLDQPRDPGITFESTGIDYLIVDEVHDYKNLQTVSSIPDANIAGSGRATDLATKLEYLRQTHGNRVATVATATPIANSITEAHVMQRYLRPDLLREAGVEAFDAWAATFGESVSDVEMAPQGGGTFRMKTRFAKFVNVPDMLRMWHVFADVKTAEDLNLPTPDLAPRADGKRLPQTVAIDPGDLVRDYVTDLGERAEAIAARTVSPDEDNMLWVATDGRKAAVDIRMVDPDADVTGQPVALHTVADNIARIYHDNKENEYTDSRTGEPSPVKGALQLVFSDLGTPSQQWNAYDELREQLVARGVPEAGIRYVHEAKNDAEKARMFSAAREGRIAVLIGSTAKMGAGTNVQTRAIALHDVDCPWRPADLAQRHGRIVRQLNQNPEVEIYQYVATGTFSAYMWQAIERKSKFINQVMRGRLDVREINDLADESLTAAEAKALASGNPLLLERSVALNETARLERLERAWRRNQSTLAATAGAAAQRADQLEANLTALHAAVPHVRDLDGDNFRLTVQSRQYSSRSEAAHALSRWATSIGLQYSRPMIDDRPRGPVGEISGFPIYARTRTDLGTVKVDFTFEGVPGARVSVPVTKVSDANDIGLVRMLEHRITHIDDLIAKSTRELTDVRQAHQDALNSQGASFKHSAALQQARADLAAIDEQLQTTPDETAPTPVPAPAGNAVIDNTGPHRPPASTPDPGLTR